MVSPFQRKGGYISFFHVPLRFPILQMKKKRKVSLRGPNTYGRHIPGLTREKEKT